jgi:hypothetical protein
MNLTKVFLNSKRSLTDKLFDYVSSYDIFCNLIGEEIKVGKFYHSPIRSDKKPTFLLFVPEDKDEVFFKDFAWVGGNVFKFAKLFALYQESINLSTHIDIVRYIDSRLGVGLFDSTVKKDIIRRVADTSFYASKRIIKFKAREYTVRDLKYWSKYHVNEEILKLFNVRSVHKLLNERDEVVWTVSQRTLTFVYVIFNKVKLYRPEESLEFKWRNTCPGHYIQGIEQLKKLKSNNKKIIITKSLKDVMVFYVFLHEKYDVIAPHSETYIFSDKFLNSLYKKYDEIILIYDFDLAGVTGVNKLRKRNKDKFTYKFVSTERLLINKQMKLLDKDISDYSDGRSKEEVTNHLINTMRL